MNTAQILTPRIGVSEQPGFSRRTSPVPSDLENRILRQAVQENLVSFPSQVPLFPRLSRPDLQQRSVVLYFVMGWTMDDIARRFRLGRQRMGQILTAWRIRAVREGYIQTIEPEHPLFRRVRLEPPSQVTEMPASSTFTPADELKLVIARVALPEEEEPKLDAPSVAELRGSNLAEELRAIVDVLDNQLRLCSKPLGGNIESCDPLLARAITLCTRLEVQKATANHKHEWRDAAVLSAAKELFQRFQEHALKKSEFTSVNRKAMPPRSSHRVAVSM